MRLEPPSNVDNSRTVSERISRFLASLNDLDVLFQLLGILVGLAFLGYVVSAWVIHLFVQEHYIAGVLLAAAGVVLTGFAFVRVPAAMYGLFASASICAVALFSGYSAAVLP